MKIYNSDGGELMTISKVERKGIAGQDYVHGYSETPRVPFIEGDVSMVPELSTEEIENIRDATVTAELINGTTYTLVRAWCTSAFDLNTAEGMFRVRFEGEDTQEIK